MNLYNDHKNFIKLKKTQHQIIYKFKKYVENDLLRKTKIYKFLFKIDLA